MPTQEERLSVVEQSLLQFKTETVHNYQDMAMQLTMVKGLTETTIGRLATIQWEMNQRFNQTDHRLDTLETTLNNHTTRLDRLETKVDTIQTTLAEILARLPEKP
jgi:uncharacterized protein Yka (UPF0111/DUF47 family)